VSSTDVLLHIATAAQLFHASDGTGFADLIIDGHRETWPLRGKRFQGWLRQHPEHALWRERLSREYPDERESPVRYSAAQSVGHFNGNPDVYDLDTARAGQARDHSIGRGEKVTGHGSL
jgi:hypothetical protein